MPRAIASASVASFTAFNMSMFAPTMKSFFALAITAPLIALSVSIRSTSLVSSSASSRVSVFTGSRGSFTVTTAIPSRGRRAR